MPKAKSLNRDNRKRFRIKPILFVLSLLPFFLGFVGSYFFTQFNPFDLMSRVGDEPTVLGVSAPNVLSFQGRLTDLSDTPITSSSSVTFSLYDVPTGGTPLWTGSCSITPDQDGIFDVLLGSTCGNAIPDTLFSENDDTYLGITVGSDSEMSPRQKIAAAAYALNADTLQGFVPSQTPIANQVVVLDENGNLDFGVTNPEITSSGDIILSPTENVGIGVTDPTAFLDLKGSTTAASSLRIRAGVEPTAPNVGEIYSDGTSLYYYDGVAWVDLSSEGYWTQSTDDIYYNIGKVGVGVTDPTAHLDILGSTTSNASLRIRTGVAPTAPNIGDMYADGTAVYYFNGTDWVNLSGGSSLWTQSGDDLYYITGNVGIGTDTPTSKLSIAGTGDLLNIYSGTSNIFTVTDSQITSHVPHAFTSSGDVSVGYDMYFTNQTSSKIESYGLLSIIAGEAHESNNLTLKAYNSGRLIIESSNLTSNYDGVGIGGVSAPTAYLDIKESLESKSSLRIRAGVQPTTPNIGEIYSDGTSLYYYDGVAWVDLTSEGYWTQSTDDIYYNIGNVGVGVIDPTSFLDIAGSTTSNASLRIRAGVQPTAPNTGEIYSDGTALYYYNGTAWRDLTAGFWSQSGDDLYYLTGNVGIGTDTPTSKLSIAGTGNLLSITSGTSNIFTVTDTLITSHVPHAFTASGDLSVGYDMYFTNQTSSKIESYGPFSIIVGESHESNNLTLKTYNSGRLIIETSNLTSNYDGVGIGGVTSPTAYLDIKESIESSSSLRIRAGVQPTAPNIGEIYSDGTSLYYYDGVAWVDLTSEGYWTQSTDDIYYDIGNVGVGVIDPTSFLDIASSTETSSSLRIRTGVAPTAPNTGEIYASGPSLYYYNGSTWIDLMGGGTWDSIGSPVADQALIMGAYNTSWDYTTGEFRITQSGSDAFYLGRENNIPHVVIGSVNDINTYETGKLAATWYDDSGQEGSFNGPIILENEITLVNWSNYNPNGQGDYFSLRLVGYVKPAYTETYTFYSTSDDGQRLWVDGTQLVDNWIPQGSTERSGTIALEADVWYPIVAEHYEITSGEVYKLEWSSASQPREVLGTTPESIAISGPGAAEILRVNGNIDIYGALQMANDSGSNGQILLSQGTNTNPVWSDVDAAIESYAWIQGGNSFGETGVLGTTDSYGIDFKTNDVTRLSIDASGKVGIGESTPEYALDVAAGVDSYVAKFASTSDLAKINIADNDTNVYISSKDQKLTFGMDFDELSYSILSENGEAREVYFSTDGKKFYVMGLSGDRVYQYSVSTPWEVHTASYDSVSLHVGSQDGEPNSIAFNTNGTIMYMTGDSGNRIYQYDLSSAWELDTATYNSESLYVGWIERTPLSTTFSQNGEKMYLTGNHGDNVYEFDLSSAWNVTSAVFVSNVSYDSSFHLGSQDSNPHSTTFSSDGTAMYMTGENSDRIYQYSLSTPWDTNTATYTSNSLYIGWLERVPLSTTFSDDGTVMYLTGQYNDNVYKFDLSVAWDITSAVFDSNVSYEGSYHVGSQDGYPNSIAFNPDGSIMYLTGDAGNRIYQYSLATPWDTTTASYASKSFAVGSQEGTPRATTFSADGTLMYVVGSSSDTVHQYLLSTAWDISTATYTSVSFSVSSQETDPRSVKFNPTGTIMYILGQSSDTIHQYTLSIAWDVSSASITTSYSISSEDTGPTGVTFNTDGTTMFMVGHNSDKVNQYTLSVAWDVSTASVIGNPFPVRSIDDTPLEVEFNADGSRMYLMGYDGDRVRQYTLSTPWNINSDGYYYVGGEETDPRSVKFNSTGTSMYVLGLNSDTVYQYTLSTPWAVNTATLASSFSVSSEEYNPTGLRFNPDGTTMFVVGYGNDNVYQYSLSSAWDISTASYTSKLFSVLAPEDTSVEVDFSTDGTKMYVTGNSSDRVYQYTLTTPWDITTTGSYSVYSQENDPRSVKFNPTGTRMYVVGLSSDTVYQYDLSTPWVVASASYGASFSVASEDTLPVGVHFSTDGKLMYVIGYSSDRIFQYRLDTAWDITTAYRISNSFSVIYQDGVAREVEFNADGTKMYVMGYDSDRVYEYDLSIPWVVDSASYNSVSLHVGSQDGYPNSISFSSDGTMMYMTGDQYDRVYQYDLSTAWDLSTATYSSNSVYVGWLERTPFSSSFSVDGTEMYLTGNFTDNVYKFDLSTPWDITTAIFESNVAYDLSFYVGSQDGYPNSMSFNTDGTIMYMVGDANNRVYQYSVATPWDLSTATYLQNYYVGTQEGTPRSVTFNGTGDVMYLIGNNDNVYQYNLVTPWDISTASYASVAFSISAQETDPRSIEFDSTGANMYVVGPSSDSIHQYTLSIPWDISTATFTQSFSVASEDTVPAGLSFISDGTVMFMIGYSSDYVYKYSLTTAWDISTATSTGESFPIKSRDDTGMAVEFNTDGSNMYVMGYEYDRVHQYSLNTPWDLTTNGYYYVGGEEVDPFSVKLNSKGTSMYIVGHGSDTVFQYTLSTPWAVNTATLTKSFSVASEETYPSGVTFNPTGTGMYIIGYHTDKVYQYTLSTAWDIDSASLTSDRDYMSITSRGLVGIGLRGNEATAYMDLIGSTNSEASLRIRSGVRPDNGNVGDIYSNGSTLYYYDGSSWIDLVAGAWNYSGDDLYYDVGSVGIGTNTPEHSLDVDSGVDNYVAKFASSSDLAKVYLADNDTSAFISTKDQKLSFGIQAKNTSYSVQSQDGVSAGVYFSTDGDKMFMMGHDSDRVYQYSLDTLWDLSTATYDSVSLHVGSQDGDPYGLAFNSNGTRLYMLGNNSDSIYQYDLSSAWDLTTATYNSVSYYVGWLERTPLALTFSNNGSKMYVTGNYEDNVYEFDLATEWDISTASFTSNLSYESSFHVGSQDGAPYSMTMSSDGTGMYIVGEDSDTIYQYVLSTPWDMSTASYDSKSLWVGWVERNPRSVTFSSDGSIMHITGAFGDSVYEFHLTTPWDITTASLDSNVSYDLAFYVGSQEGAPNSMSFNPDGSIMYMVGTDNDTVYQYTLSTPWDVSTASYASKSLGVGTQDTVPRAITFDDDGDVMFLIGNNDTVYQYTLTTAWDISTATYASVSFSVTAQETDPRTVKFNSTGTSMYITGLSSDSIHQYTLSAPWDITTATFNQSLSVSTEETAPCGVSFNSDGTAMFIVGHDADKVHKYSLSVGWDISTASLVANPFPVKSRDDTPLEVEFSSDGSVMYVMGNEYDRVFQYDLTTPWDVTTTGYYAVSGQETDPRSVRFNSTGTNMYIVGVDSDNVHQYSLTTGWDLSTTTFTQSYSVASEDTLPSGISFSSDGTSMFMVGYSSDKVYQYSLLTPWDISTASLTANVFPLKSRDDTALGIDFSSDGTDMYIMGLEYDRVHHYSLSTPWDISTDDYLYVGGEETNPRSVKLSNSGDQLYILGLDSDTVYSYDLTTPWDLTGATYSSDSFYVGNEDTSPSGVTFRSDGKVMYIDGYSTDRIYQYDLSTAWDINSVSRFDNSFSVVHQDTSPLESEFNDDGTKMYLMGHANDRVYQYSLSTPWDVNSATYDSVSFHVGSQEGYPGAAIFNTDGSIMYVVGWNSDRIYQYTLSTPWDLSTASYTTKSFSFSSQETAPRSVAFNNDGTVLYMIGSDTDSIRSYTLSTPWDISTATYDSVAFSVSSEETDPRSVRFSSTGKVMFIIGPSSDSVHQYALETAWDLNSASFVKSFSVSSEDVSPAGLTFNSQGTVMYMTADYTDSVYQYSLSTAWDIGTSSSTYDRESMSINSRGLMGIGVEDAMAYLDIKGANSQTASLRIRTGSAPTNANIGEIYSSGSTLYYYDGIEWIDLIAGVWGLSGDDIYYSKGNVGIGTSTPVRDLDVLGVGRFALDGSLSSGDLLEVDHSAFFTQAQNIPGNGLSVNRDYTYSNIGEFGVSLDNYNAYTTNSGSVITINHDVQPGNNRILLVKVATNYNYSNRYATSVTFNGLPLTRLVYRSTSIANAEIWYLLNPPNGTYDVVVNFNATGAYGMSVIASTWFGVNLDDPFNTPAVGAGGGLTNSGGPLTFEVPAEVGETVVDIIASTGYRTPGEGQTLIHRSSEPLFYHVSGTSYKDGEAGSTTMYWEDSTGSWAAAGVSLKPALGEVPSLNISGSLASFSSNCTSVYGPCVDVSNILSLTQNYTGATGAALNIQNLGTGADILFNDSPILRMADGGSMVWDDGTNSLMTLEDAGTTGNLYITGDVFTEGTMDLTGTLQASGMKLKNLVNGNGVKFLTLDADGETVKMRDLTSMLLPTGTEGQMLYNNDGAWTALSDLIWDDTNNRFGIGTLTPESTLHSHVESTDASEFRITNTHTGSTSADGLVLGYGASSDDAIINNKEAGAIKFYTGDTEQMRIDSTGKVGVGIVAPTAYMDVTGATTSASSLRIRTGTAPTAPDTGDIYSDGTALYYYNGTDWKDLTVSAIWSESGTDTYFNTGKVGIGTDAPEYSLDILSGTTDEVARFASSDDLAKIYIEDDDTTAFISSKDSVLSFGLKSSTPKTYEVGDSYRSIEFSSDGTKMYSILNVTTMLQEVHQYDLSTAWDITSATSASKTVDISTQETSPESLAFNSDGTAMYMVGTDNDTVYQYTLATAWDVSTATYASKSYLVSSEEGYPTSLAFSSDGTSMYIVGPTSMDTVFQYTLSTAWDVSTASYSSNAYIVGSEESTTTSLAFSSDGAKMYITGKNNDEVFEYTLSTPWNVSTASYSSTSFYFGGDYSPVDLAFKPDGTLMYVFSDELDATVYGYTLATAWDVSTAQGEALQDFEYMSLTNEGFLGIGTSTPSLALDVVGNARFSAIGSGTYASALSITSDGTLTTSTSDERLKTDIVTIDTPLEKVKQLRGVYFNWKDTDEPKRMTGMIAQEVMEVMPELVFQNQVDGYYGINYGETTGLLIEAIKEQQRQIEGLARLYDPEGVTGILEVESNLEKILKVEVTEDGDIEMLGGEVLLTGDGVLSIRKLKLREDYSTGSGTIISGKNSVVINTLGVTADSKVFVSATSDTRDKALYVTDIKDGESFKVSINEAIDTDITFDWLIVDSK